MAEGRLARLVRSPSLWLALVLLLGLGAYGALRARGPAVNAVPVVRRDLEQHIVASGRVMPPARSNVASQLAGLVVTVGAVEGQHVKKGDLLIQLDDAEARA